MVDFKRHLEEFPVEAILDERAATYGAFKDLARVAVRLRRVITEELRDRQKVLDPDMEEALVMICTKVARVVNGDPASIDQWRDVSGYAQLVADRLEGKIR
jgi:predicted RNA-binding Zn ribbon-like protein